MAHNLNVLEYMYNKIVCKNLASVGYYVGGMSEAELKKSEKKQIILSSYQMAQEGLDIPSLNSEFLITPKTDIVQTVGRILRAKHATKQPIIYDFVDTHDVFQRQWLKRKAYYKKQNYEIIGTSSIDYNGSNTSWKSIYKPKIIGNINNSNTLTCNKTNIMKQFKNSSIKSNSSTDVSITQDSDSEYDDTCEVEDEPPNNVPICLLKMK
jgi:superfamily II DNA or RNA helicase